MEATIKERLSVIAAAVRKPEILRFANHCADVENPLDLVQKSIKKLPQLLFVPEEFAQDFSFVASAGVVVLLRRAAPIMGQYYDTRFWDSAENALERLAQRIEQHIEETNDFIEHPTNFKEAAKNLLRMIQSDASHSNRIWQAIRALAGLHTAVYARSHRRK